LFLYIFNDQSKGEYIDAPALEHHFKVSKRSDSVGLDPTPESPNERVENPILSNDRSRASGMSSFDIVSDDLNPAEVKFKFFFYGWIHYFVDVIYTLYTNVTQFSFELQSRKAYILIDRAFWTLMKRGKLVVGSTCVALFFAFNFGWILGPSTDEAPSVSAVFAMGAVLLIMTNLQFAFFLFHNNEVCHLFVNFPLSD
jgi:hypothetical protein